MADSLDYVATKLEVDQDGKTLNIAIQTLLQEIITEHGAVVFNGDGYSAEWHAEAGFGLPNMKTTPAALPALQKPGSSRSSRSTTCCRHAGLHGRYEVYLEQYIKTLKVEANLTIKMAKGSILPAAVRYLTELASASSAEAARQDRIGGRPRKGDRHARDHARCGTRRGRRAEGNAVLRLSMGSAVVDTLETLVADDLWPLPTYQRCCSSAER